MNFMILSQPYYNPITQNYINILVCNIIPDGPLRHIVRPINIPKHIQQKSCCFALLNIYPHDNTCKFMTPNNIPDLTTFLLDNNYKINTELTNTINQSSLKQTIQTLLYSITYIIKE